jgi:hypothetical protein
MFADRQELDMGKAEIPDIVRQLLGELAVGQPLIVAFAPP